MFRYSQIIQIQMTLWETPNKKKLLLCFWFWLLFLCLHWCGRFVWVITYHWVEYASRYSHPQCWYKMIPNCGDITVCTQHQYSKNNGPIIFILAVITFLNVYVHFMATRWQCLIILCQQWHKKQGLFSPILSWPSFWWRALVRHHFLSPIIFIFFYTIILCFAFVF